LAENKELFMTYRITHSSGSADMVRTINKSYRDLLKTMERLSSGLRINHASDDPAGLVISENMRARIASLNQEIENTSLAIQKYNTADATINQMYSILHGIRSAAVGAANAVSDEQARDAYQNAVNRAVENYNGIIDTAAFNNAMLLDGSEGSVADIGKLSQFDLTDQVQAGEAIEAVDQALAELGQIHVDLGSTQKYQLEARRSDMEVAMSNLTAAESQIRDTDYLKAMVDLIKNEFQLKAGVAVLAHSHMTQQTVLSLLDGR
jgi:flagellin